MRRVALLLFLVISVSLAMSGVSHVRRASAQSKPETTPMQTPPKTTAPPPGGMTPPPAGNMAPPPGMPPSDHVMPPFVFNQAHADSQVAEMLEHIKGKEDMPAESVYKNIKIFKGMPAKRIPPMMVMNFSRSLGMRCSGCHKRGDFASDENKHKDVARAMWTMQQDINQKYLPDMKIDDDQPTVSCWSCHRGNHEPEVNPGMTSAQPAVQPQPSH